MTDTPERLGNILEQDHPDYQVEWFPYKTERRYERPRAAMWDNQGSVVPEFVEHLAAIGLPNPRPKAVEFFDVAVRLRDAADQPPVEVKRDDMIERLASGDLLLDEASRMLVKRPSPREAEDRAREYRESLTAASCTALANAVLQIHDVGEAGWLKLLKPIAADAVAKLDQRRWDAVHSFAAFLRDPMRRKVFGLAAAMVNHTTDVSEADPAYYMFADRRAVYRWQVDRAVGHQVVEISTRPVDGRFRIAYDVTQASLPKVGDFRPEWGAGLYSASEAIANVDRCLNEQEAEFAPPESAGHEPPKRGRAVMT